jgi:internalin A
MCEELMMEKLDASQISTEQLVATLEVKPKYAAYDEQGCLIELDLSQSDMTQLPESLGELSHVQRLNLSGNRLTQISLDVLGRLSNLQHLDLHKNQLTCIPSKLVQLGNLQHLDLHKNQLTHISPELGKLCNLQYLDLHKNQLTHIPPELGQLRNLQHLDLYDNQLRHIPPELGQLTSLQNLDLSGNQLRHIPPELGQLTNLQNLQLHKNQLTQISLELGQLTNLQYMSLSKNPNFLTPPPEIVAQGTATVLSFLRELAREYVVKYEAKLMLVGEANAGKSSLLRALHGKAFETALETTHGIEIDTLTLPHPALPDQSLLLNVWDFGGQDIYRATHQFFLTERGLYLVVWDARLGAEDGNLTYWLNTIRMLAPNTSVLLVATHSDGQTLDLNVAQYRADYPQIVQVLQVNNATGVGIDDLKRALAKYAVELPCVGQPWLPSWVEVEQELLASSEHYISTDTYVDLCMAKGIRAALARGTLGSYLHDLGEILYFRDDPTLSDIVILKPNWVAKAISLVLEDQGIRDRSGILVSSDLARIWSVDEHGQPYDPALYPLFLRLMECFDLCYPIDVRGGYESYHFIPEPLPPHAPSSLPSWTVKELKAGKVRVEMTYHLDFVPAGIMNWFIARTHQYTCSMHWRKGVVLSYQGHLARVELFAERKELHIEVWGPEPHAFFVILKDALDLILSRFAGLHVRQEVPCICHRQTGEAQPCPEVYRYEQDLIKRLNQGVETIQCRESFCNIAVRELLYGHHISTTAQTRKAISAEINEIIQQLDVLAEQQNKLRSEVHNEQANILQKLNAIAVQQSQREVIQYRSSDFPRSDTAQYKARSRYDEAPELAAEPPSLFKQAWDWYKRQQPPKRKKPLSKFKIGCLVLIIGFILCLLLGRTSPAGNGSSPVSPAGQYPMHSTKLSEAHLFALG